MKYTRQIKKYCLTLQLKNVQVSIVKSNDGYTYYSFTNLFFYTAADIAKSATGLQFEYCTDSLTRIKN
jgi:hypothetical protein